MRCDPVETRAISTSHDCAMNICGCGSRRSFLRSFSALGMSTMVSAPAVLSSTRSVMAQVDSTAKKPHRVDVHHHFYPPELLDAWNKADVRNAPVVQRWTLAAAIEQMNKGGVATAVLSLPTGINLPNLSADDRLSWTMRINDYASKVRSDHPGRFGVFAFLPMPDINASLKSIEYALDVMKADGIGLNTSYGNKWLGDTAFKPVMEELNRRKATVFVHPLGPACCNRLMSYVPASFIEYPQDTNRTVMSMLFSGTLTNTRDVKWIFCHAGAAVPELAGRVKSLARSGGGSRDAQVQNMDQILPDGVDFELKRLYYETANAAFVPNMTALLKYVSISQVLFGTDYPYVSVTENVDDLLKAGLTPAELKAIESQNAHKLIPSLKA